MDEKINLHTHTYLCRHAIGNIDDYVLSAINNNYTVLGFSDHGPLRAEWTRRMNNDEYKNIYLKDINEAIIKYPHIKIYKGLELEYYKEFNSLYEKYLKDLDYLILGQHETSLNHISVFTTLTMESINSYKDDVIAGMNTGYFKILAHPDVFLCRNDIWNDEIEAISKEIIECAIKNKVYLEINGNGIRRRIKVYTKDNEESYSFPRLEFWRLVSTYKNVLVVIGTDAHDPKQLGDGCLEEAYLFAKKLNIEITKNIFKEL